MLSLANKFRDLACICVSNCCRSPVFGYSEERRERNCRNLQRAMGIPGKLSRGAARRKRMEIRRFKVVANGITVVNGPIIGKRSKLCKASATPVIACYVKPGRMNDIDRPQSKICNSTNSRFFTSPDDRGNISAIAFGKEEKEQEPLVENGQIGYGRACPSHGAVSVCGRRREMEDALTVAPAIADFPDAAGVRHTLHFFAVYDGHGGPQAAALCKDRLHHLLKTEVDNFAAINGCLCGFGAQAQWQKIMAGCFLRLDAEIAAGRDLNKNPSNAVAGTVPETAGSTAVVAVVSSDQIVVANCGDSRAVLSRGGTAVALSVDHKPDRADEMARIESSGGKVIYWDGPRVLGVLATSRSLGDRYLKPYVTAEPEVTCSRRTREDEFLILASDGLWDVLSNEMACDVARKCLEAGGRMKKYFCCDETPAAMAAALLTKLAVARGSCDNITVLVVDLINAR